MPATTPATVGSVGDHTSWSKTPTPKVSKSSVHRNRTRLPHPHASLGPHSSLGPTAPVARSAESCAPIPRDMRRRSIGSGLAFPSPCPCGTLDHRLVCAPPLLVRLGRRRLRARELAPPARGPA